MTKESLASAIIDSIENHETKDEQIEAVIALLSILEPKDREQFAKWGYPAQQSTPEECWN